MGAVGSTLWTFPLQGRTNSRIELHCAVVLVLVATIFRRTSHESQLVQVHVDGPLKGEDRPGFEGTDADQKPNPWQGRPAGFPISPHFPSPTLFGTSSSSGGSAFYPSTSTPISEALLSFLHPAICGLILTYHPLPRYIDWPSQRTGPEPSALLHRVSSNPASLPPCLPASALQQLSAAS
jgi:hypothetical protein